MLLFKRYGKYEFSCDTDSANYYDASHSGILAFTVDAARNSLIRELHYENYRYICQFSKDLNLILLSFSSLTK